MDEPIEDRNVAALEPLRPPSALKRELPAHVEPAYDNMVIEV